jgi:sialate O-acetylesterase
MNATFQKFAFLSVMLTTGCIIAVAPLSVFAEEDAPKTEKKPAATASPAEIAAMKSVEANSWTVPGIGMEMILIPKGTFTMGSPDDEEYRREDEAQRKVTLSKPFYMGKYEVTQEQFYALTFPEFDVESWQHFRGPISNGGAFHYRFQPPGVNHIYGEQLQLDFPMECFSWTRAVDYCKKLTAIERKVGRLPEGYEYRLPTEAEWEYACRAGTTGLFNIDADLDKLKAEAVASEGDLVKQKYLNTFAFAWSPNQRWSKTGKVGGRTPNAWGLRDMHGNVAEWVLDTYAPYDKQTSTTDPIYFTEKAGQEKVIRGGSMAGGFPFMRCAVRYSIPYHANYYGFVGMRMVLAPKIEVPLPGELKMAHLFDSHMVLQRNLDVPIWGWATPGEKVTVEFAGQEKTATTDQTGKWRVKLSPMKANAKGQTLTVRSLRTKKKVECTDVLVGDVWLCSGQSNMDYEVAGGRRGKRSLLAKFDAEANYPAIRHFTVPEKSAVVPQEDMSAGPVWQVCSPETVSKFTAVGYFYGRMIHRDTDLPIGLISSAVGGTKIDCWTRAKELSKVDGCESAVATVLERAEEIKAGTFTMVKAMDAWADKHDPGSAVKAGWMSAAYDDAGWKTVSLPGRWGGLSVDELKGFSGIVWFRRTVDIPASFAGKDIVVSLGRIDDRDTSFFNGVKIGTSVNFDDRRLYRVAAKQVVAGKNVIAIRLWNGWGDGGVWGDPAELSIYPVGHEDKKISLAGDWLYKKGLPSSKMPVAPQRMGHKSRDGMVTGLYNGMIKPVVPYAIRGAIWYQGESNGDEGISYMHKMRALVEGWRSAWGQGDFPFYYVQLANFQDPGENPEGGDGWAKTRMAQLKALEIKNTGMAVAIELADEGNPKDVHPENKKDVGERLALWALAKDYGKAITCSGPLYKSTTVKGREAIIHFDHVGKGLMVGKKVGLSPAKEVAGGTLKRFAMAGADGIWHWADAKIVGDTVVVSSKAVATPVAVRYAYTMNPAGCNLYNKAGLPASPFTTDQHWHGEVDANASAKASASANPPKATLHAIRRSIFHGDKVKLSIGCS